MSARPARITSAGQLALELPLELPPIALAPEWKDQQRLWGHAFHPMCSYLASFPAALTHAFIARYSRPAMAAVWDDRARFSRWVAVEAQPIAVEDVIAYLAGALDLPAGAERIYEIGGPDRVTYGDLMREYARQRRLKRLLIPVPLLTPRLSSLWLGLVTPVYARVGRKLIDSLRNPTVIRDPAALAAFPVRPRSVRDAIARALVNEDEAFARTRWSDALSSAGLTERYGGVTAFLRSPAQGTWKESGGAVESA